MEQLTLFDALPPYARGRTVADVQRELDAKKDEGTFCPCCGAVVKVYRRMIHAQMAAWLIELCRSAKGQEWVDQRMLTARGGDYAKLMYWRLVEHHPKDPEDKARRTSGLWRPTDLGQRFARGLVALPRVAVIYRGQCLGFSGDLVYVRYCLGKRFNYEELWP